MKATTGVIRIGPTRVTLQAVVAAYDLGAGPEEIALRYPVLTHRRRAATAIARLRERRQF